MKLPPTRVMRASDDAEVFRGWSPLVGVLEELAPVFPSVNAPVTVTRREAGHHVRHADADIRSVELVNPRLLDIDVVVAEAERAHRVRAQKVRVTDDDGVDVSSIGEEK
jgi:hypothetical protein